MDEMYQYTLANLIFANNHGNGLSLSTLPVTGVVNNGGGSYYDNWNVPTGTQSYRIRYGAKQIVDWIGYDPGTATFIGNPPRHKIGLRARMRLVFGSSGTTQSMTISTGLTGLTAANFMVKAYTGSGSGSSPTTPPPTISMTAPAGGASLTGTVTVSASAAASAGEWLAFNLSWTAPIWGRRSWEQGRPTVHPGIRPVPATDHTSSRRRLRTRSGMR